MFPHIVGFLLDHMFTYLEVELTAIPITMHRPVLLSSAYHLNGIAIDGLL